MTSAGPDFERGRPCGNGQTRIMYAWGRDAPEMHLPDGTVYY